MKDLRISKIRGLQDLAQFKGIEDMAYEYGYADVHIYEDKGRKVYSEMKERTKVEVGVLDDYVIFGKTIGLVSMIIDNKGKMEDDKARKLLFVCANVFGTLCDKEYLIEWIYEKLVLTYEKGFVPCLWQYDVDKLNGLDTIMILSLDMAIIMEYCDDVSMVMCYETIKGDVILNALNGLHNIAESIGGSDNV